MNKYDLKRNYPMLTGKFRKQGYDWWWHNFTGVNAETGEERTFFVEYFTVNPGRAEKEPVLGQTPENKMLKKQPSYVMIKAGWWGKGKTQLHRFISWDKVELSKDKKTGFLLKAEDCLCSETEMKGSVELSKEESKAHPEYMCDFGSMSWNLKIKKEVSFNVGYGANSLFRAIKAFEMYWHAQGIKSKYEGTVTANGETFVIKEENSFGYADKNWGSNFTSPWVWLSSWDIYSKTQKKQLENTAFDIGGGCPVAFGIHLKRKLLGEIWYEGKSYEFNFSKFWTFSHTYFDCKETDKEIMWHVVQETNKAILDTKITCKKKDMLLVNYEDPLGMKRHNRLWNGGTGSGVIGLYKKEKGIPVLIDEMEVKHVGCEYGEYCLPEESGKTNRSSSKSSKVQDETVQASLFNEESKKTSKSQDPDATVVAEL